MDIINADVIVVLAVVCIIIVAIISNENNGVRSWGICAAVLILIIYLVMKHPAAELMIKMVLDYSFSVGSLVVGIGIIILFCCCCIVVAINAGGNQLAIRE